jgi:hypothetical protein
LQPEVIEVKDGSQIVLDVPALLFVTRLNRPYTVSQQAEKGVANPYDQISSETLVSEPKSVVFEAEALIDESIENIQASNPSDQDVEDSKMKWFHEEIKQSPVSLTRKFELIQSRDGSWTVEDKFLSDAEAAESSELFSMSSDTELPVVEKLPSLETVKAISPAPYIDDKEDAAKFANPTPEPSQRKENDKLHINATTVIRTVQTVKSRFVIVGGQVQRMETPQMQEKPTSSATSTCIVTKWDHDVASLASRIPPRKMRKEERPIKEPGDYEDDCDGWSTESEDVDSTPKDLVNNDAEDGFTHQMTSISSQEQQKETERTTANEVEAESVTHLNVANEETDQIPEQSSHSTPPSQPVSASAAPVHDANYSSFWDGVKDVPEFRPRTPRSEGKYEIVAGRVRKIAPATFKVQTENLIPGASTPLNSPTCSIASQHSLGRRHFNRRSYSRSPPRADVNPKLLSSVEVPSAAKTFVNCGENADVPTIGSLIRKHAPWAGAPLHSHCSPVFVGSTNKAEHSETEFEKPSPPGNLQEAVQQEPFDPFRWEPGGMLESLKAQHPPILATDTNLRQMLFSPPSCFCGKRCSQFEGIVPVYVCGMFSDE